MTEAVFIAVHFAVQRALQMIGPQCVGDLDGLNMGGACIAGIPLTAGGGLLPDPTFLQQIVDDPNCFSFIETIPAGFVPRFGGDNEDMSFFVGVRGELNVGRIEL